MEHSVSSVLLYGATSCHGKTTTIALVPYLILHVAALFPPAFTAAARSALKDKHNKARPGLGGHEVESQKGDVRSGVPAGVHFDPFRRRSDKNWDKGHPVARAKIPNNQESSFNNRVPFTSGFPFTSAICKSGDPYIKGPLYIRSPLFHQESSFHIWILLRQ